MNPAHGHPNSQGPQAPRPRPPSAPGARRPKKRGGGGFIVVLAFVIVGGAGFYIWQQSQKRKSATQTPAAVVTKSVVPSKTTVEPLPKANPLPPPVPETKSKSEPTTPYKMADTPPPTQPPPTQPLAPAVDVAAVFGGTLSLDERGGAAPAALDRAKAAREAALEHGMWAEWAALLRKSLLATMKDLGAPSVTPQGLAGLSKSAAFTLALEQATFVATLPESARVEMTKQTDARDFQRWLLATPAALQAWLLTVGADDEVPGAIKVWAALVKRDPAAMGQYANLALACAVVFESPMEVEKDYQRSKITAEERYDYYRRHADRGDLAINPSKLSARDLVYVVSAPVAESEMEWALKKLTLRQKSWGTAYDMVEYDMERAVKDTNKYDAYTFSEILKKGGICGDRSYFAAYTARAAGIPAAIISGDGARGGHAWISWLSDDHKWDFSGRYAGYPLGSSRNPQTKKPESEQEFLRRSSKGASDEGLLRGLRPVWLGRALETEQSHDIAGVIFDSATALSPDLAPVWRARLAFWASYRSAAPVEQWRILLDGLKRQFKDDPEILAEARAAEEKFVFPRQNSTLAMKELKKDARRLEKADGETGVDQADQIAKVLKQQADVLATSGGLDSGRSLYDKSYREHGRNPAVFKRLADDCWTLVKADPAVAKKACKDMESAFKRYVEAGGDYFDVTSQMSALEVVAKCYREIGEEKKATDLEEAVAKANEKASKRAL